MTPSGSKFRLWFYICSAMLAVFSGGIMHVDTSDWRSIALFVAAIIGAGLGGARGYLDQSVSQVVDKVSDTLDFKKFPPLP